MWPFSTAAASVVSGSHTVDYRATAVGPLGGSQIVPISGGLVTASATSQVRRTATVNIADPLLWPVYPTDLLAPYGSALLIECGIVVPGLGTEWIPVITGVLTQNNSTVPQTNSSQGIVLTLADLSQKVHENRLTAPIQVGGSGVTVVQAITALIVGGYPDAVVVDETGDTTACPVLTVQQERWTDGVEPLATSIGAEVYCDPLGAFRIRYQPTLDDNLLVWQVATGPHGNLIQAQRTRTRASVYNKVIVLGQASNGAAPVLATVEDDDLSSPTYVGGPFGIKPRYFSSPTVTTADQALAAAKAILARAKGRDTQYVLSTVTNPALDVGDVVKLLGSTGQGLHILDQVTIPLDFTQQQQLTTRSVALPDEQGGSLEQLS